MFNPALEKEDKEEFRFDAPTVVEKYLEEHFRKSLSKEQRTAMLRRHPKPDTKAVIPPKLDQYILDFAGKKLDKARDAQLSRIQANVLYAANPLSKLWSDLVEQKLDTDTESVILVPDVLDVLQRTLVLLGSANNAISEARRENALEAIHQSLKKYGKGDFTQAEGDLFGEAFKDQLVKKVEVDSALSKAVRIVSKSSDNPATRQYQKPYERSRQGGNQFFRGGRASQYGAASGRYQNPYTRQGEGRGKYPPGKTYPRKGNVFSRLGPNPPNSSQYRKD